MDVIQKRTGAVRPLVGSIVQAAAVMRHLGSLSDGQGVTAIARALGLGPSSCFNVLKTLVAEDFAVFDPVTKTYTLGSGVIDLARNALGHDPVLAAARDGMDRLAKTHDATVALWRLVADDRLMLAALAESTATTRIHMVIGQRQPAAAGATGRAVLAARQVDDDMVARSFAGVRWQNPPTPTEYRHQIAQARTRGWALDVDAMFQGITTIATALCDAKGTVRHCLSASMFTGHDTVEQIELIGAAVHAVATAAAQAAYPAEKKR